MYKDDKALKLKLCFDVCILLWFYKIKRNQIKLTNMKKKITFLLWIVIAFLVEVTILDMFF